MDDCLSKKIEYLKEQLSNQEKLASLGVLSAGIAHEIQNPLNFVINFSKLSVKLLEDMQDVIEEIKGNLSEESNEELEDIVSDLQCNLVKILENGERASSIVKGILLYSRGNDTELIPTNLKKVIKEYIWLSYHSIRANNKNFNISILENYAEGIPAIPVVPQDISRAVLNIMNNACYAVYRKSINSMNYSPVVKIDLWQEGEWVKLSIEDNGTGIPEDVLPNLFQPFFTTKPVGEGTGLGLSITKTIVEEKHHGKIEVETSSGEYTRFTISLPINNHSV